MNTFDLSFAEHRRRFNTGILLGCALLAAVLSSCDTTSYLQTGDLLYNGSKLEFTQDSLHTKPPHSRELSSDLLRFERQEPNRRFAGLLPIRLGIYNFFAHEDLFQQWLHNDRKFIGIGAIKPAIDQAIYGEENSDTRQWLIETVGEPPVLLDSMLIEQALVNMEDYLHNRGYFNPVVEYEVTQRKRKARVLYTTHTGNQYFLRNLEYHVADSSLKKLVSENITQPVLTKGQPFDLVDFKSEKKRIQELLRNEGYFKFESAYVEFDIDSSIGNHMLDVLVNVKNPVGMDSHPRYRIGEVAVYTDFIQDFGSAAAHPDTTIQDGLYIINSKSQFNPRLLGNNISIRPDSVYKDSYNTLTINHLSALGVFRYVSVSYTERTTDDSTFFLDAQIRLQPVKKQNWSVELSTSTNYSGTQIGTDLNFIYRNRNLFRNADLFTLNLSSGLETQLSSEQNFLYNLDFRALADLQIPKFLLPWHINSSNLSNPLTKFGLRFTFDRRLAYYTLYNTGIFGGYSWRKEDQHLHSLIPIDINVVRLTNVTNDFRSILNANSILRQSFEETIILASNYNYIFNKPYTSIQPNGFYFRGSFELAGNLINGIDNLTGNVKGTNKMFGVSIAQYARVTADFRYYRRLGKKQSLVGRLAGGTGVAYGNTDVLPYVKQFYAGGANSNRAWNVRRLGPGSFTYVSSDTTNSFIDQTGDVLMEANLEYRFPISSFIKGALFADAGNIWLLDKDPQRPGGELSSQFVQEVGIGAGFGLRLDFQFFIFRFDVGTKIRDPGRPIAERWAIAQPGYMTNLLTDAVYNIAIGYPF